MENSTENKAWGGDWRAKFAARLHSLDSSSATELLSRHPGKPYTEVAAELGDDVAALQLEWAQFEEALRQNNLRFVAMDSLARDLRDMLPNGWKEVAKGDFDTSRVFGSWSTRLTMARSELEPQVIAVWSALKDSSPPPGWKATGPNDPIILAAFNKGWPLS